MNRTAQSTAIHPAIVRHLETRWEAAPYQIGSDWAMYKVTLGEQTYLVTEWDNDSLFTVETL